MIISSWTWDSQMANLHISITTPVTPHEEECLAFSFNPRRNEIYYIWFIVLGGGGGRNLRLQNLIVHVPLIYSRWPWSKPSRLSATWVSFLFLLLFRVLASKRKILVQPPKLQLLPLDVVHPWPEISHFKKRITRFDSCSIPSFQ